MAFSYDYYRIFYHAAKYGSFTQAVQAHPGIRVL